MYKPCMIALLLLSLLPLGQAHADKDESIYVVQRRAFSKRGKFEITPIFMASISNKFVGHVGPALALSYHLRENFALQLHGGFGFSFYSNLVLEVNRYEDLRPEFADLKQLKWFSALSVQWSPIYGKLRLIPGILGDFDIYVTAGFGIADTREPCIRNNNSCESLGGDSDTSLGFGIRKPDAAGDRFKLTGNWGFGLRIFFTEWFGIRTELHGISYGEKVDTTTQTGAIDQTTSDIRNNIIIFVGASFLL